MRTVVLSILLSVSTLSASAMELGSAAPLAIQQLDRVVRMPPQRVALHKLDGALSSLRRSDLEKRHSLSVANAATTHECYRATPS